MKNIRTKKLFTFHFSLFTLLALLMSCGKDTPSPVDTVPIDTIPERNIPTGNVPTPDWDVAPGYDYTSSMTAVVAVDLTSTYPDITASDWQIDSGDRMAAYAGEECVGVTTPTDGLFFLYIVAPSQNGDDIKLMYYSAQLHNIFEGDILLQFENGSRIGTVTDPLTPMFR